MDGYCTNCGARILDGASFCTGCGRPVNGTRALPGEPRAARSASESDVFAPPASAATLQEAPVEPQSPDTGDHTPGEPGSPHGAETAQPVRRTVRSRVGGFFTAPFLWIENRIMEPAANWLGSLAFLEILEYLGKLAILIVVIFWLTEYDDRRTEERYEAWRVINSAVGQKATGGRIDALQKLYEADQSLIGLSANNANLAGIDLYDNTDIAGLDLYEDEDGARLNLAQLEEALLDGADLQRASLWQANLRGAYLGENYVGYEDGKDANLREANLEEADLRETNLTEANLTGAKLRNANLDMAILDNAELGGADLRGATFEEASLRGADIRDARLEDESATNFTKAVLQDADLRGTDLSDAILYDANVRGADLRETNVTQDQVDVAYGDTQTRLPDSLQTPSLWEETSPPLQVQPLKAGRFYTGTFWPQLSFTVGKNWTSDSEETEDSIAIARNVRISFTNVSEVYEPVNAASDTQDSLEGTALPAPDDLVAWVKAHPNLQVTGEKQVLLGGIPATRLDVSVPSTPDDYPVECDGPCVQLFPNGDYYYLDYYYRFIILDVGGEQIFVSINSTIPEDLAEAQEVLDTVSWTDYTLPAGEEVFSGVFRPGMSFAAAGTGWQAFDQLPDTWIITRESSTFSFLRVEEVRDPGGGVSPVPEDLVGWLKNHPDLEVTNEERVSVGGVPATRLDFSVTSTPEDYPADYCGSPCLPLFRMGDDTPFWYNPGYENRVIVLQVEGETVVISLESPEGEFEAFQEKAREVLEDLEWRD